VHPQTRQKKQLSTVHTLIASEEAIPIELEKAIKLIFFALTCTELSSLLTANNFIIMHPTFVGNCHAEASAIQSQGT